MSPRPAGGTTRVGNDVVDLRHPRCRDRGAPDALTRRILTPDERDWVAGGPEPGDRVRRLWCSWAGKETAFKVVSKVRGTPPVFRHRAFETRLEDRFEEEGLVRVVGTVRWEEIAVRVEGIATDGFVHLVGWGPAEPAGGGPVLEMGVEGCADPVAPGFAPAPFTGESAALTQQEEEGVRGPLSRRARRVARARLGGHLARWARTDDPSAPVPRVEIRTSAQRPGRTAPRVVVDGELRPELDLSLSHHGRYVGWALLLPREGFTSPDGSS